MNSSKDGGLNFPEKVLCRVDTGPHGIATNNLIRMVALVWFIIDAFTHLSLELSYVLLALGPTAEKSDSIFAFVWREYARADKRWAVRDTTVISLELLTVFIVGPLCAAVAYGIYRRRPWRHALQLTVSVCELYGGFMTFVPDLLDGGRSLETRDPVLLWIYLVFMNGLWVWVPALLVWDSMGQLTHACDVAKTETMLTQRRALVKGLPSLAWFHFIAATLVLYMVLVPLVLTVYADPPAAILN